MEDTVTTIPHDTTAAHAFHTLPSPSTEPHRPNTLILWRDGVGRTPGSLAVATVTQSPTLTAADIRPISIATNRLAPFWPGCPAHVATSSVRCPVMCALRNASSALWNFLERVACGGAMHACEANNLGSGRCFWLAAWSALLALRVCMQLNRCVCEGVRMYRYIRP